MESKNNEEQNNRILNISLVVVGLMFVVLVFGQFQLNSLDNKVSATAAAVTQTTTGSSSDTIKLQSALKQISPVGVPAVYGQELGVNYNDPVNSMNILNQYDDYPGPNGRASKPINLSASLEARYIKMGSMIGCEYCCGAQALIDNKGAPACACAHSGAMRGLAKYLLQKHPEMTDDQILNELVKWKILFFPQDMAKEYLATQGVTLSGSSNPQSGSNVPSQVGGC